MKDVFDATIVCDNCDKKTEKSQLIRDGFKIRIAECPNCKKKWYHPGDLQNYEGFQELKNKTYEVKLRLVGNSYAVSIPREIIDFEEEFNREFEKLIRMTLEEPGKLSLFFNRRMRKIY